MKWLRHIWWPVIRPTILRITAESGIAGYPLTIWIELGGGKEIYINQGKKAFLDAWKVKGKEIVTSVGTSPP